MSLLNHQINASPEPLPSYIHDLEARADLAGTLRQNLERGELIEQLAVKIAELNRESASRVSNEKVLEGRENRQEPRRVMSCPHHPRPRPLFS